MFITGAELVARLPASTAVTTAEAQEAIDAAKARLDESHDGSVPDNAITRELVRDLAYAKSLKLHYIKGEAEIDTEPLDNDIERVEKRFADYDARHQTTAETAIEAPLAIVEEARF